MDNIVNGLKISILIGIVALVIFIVLVLISQQRWMVKNSAIALLITYVILPLTLLLIENIIPMFLGIIAIVIITGVLMIVGKVFLSGGEEEPGSYDSGSSKYSETPKVTKNEAPAKKHHTKMKLTVGMFFFGEVKRV